MSNVEAKIRINGKVFGVMVDSDKAIKLKEGKLADNEISEVLVSDEVYTDIKKGMRASEAELENAFKTIDVNDIVKRIIKNGELQIPTEYKQQQREETVKRVIDFLVRNAIDAKSGRSYTSERIKTAMSEAGVNVDNRPVEEQIPRIIEALKTIIPIKIETKKLKITVPAEHTGRAYSLLKDYKESEDWKNNGDLEIIAKVPSGMIMDFYDKLNKLTHGGAIAEEIKQ
ncbi:ribosome assembly factor SBDS [Candidatus Pacearchaeota archaeon CG10_big_fil_rev_8_21_14_0_10_35_13]|nr:MAG: ribosome assembly factor SBDS [Candidatus Pacearchaeota archaeon CG10_big_fil_rev_8_21_14_0_10_35_13]